MGLLKQFELVRVRLPPALRKPRVEGLWECLAVRDRHAARNRREPAPPLWR